MFSAPTSNPAVSSPSAAAAGTSVPQYDPNVGGALKSLVDSYGPTLLGEAGRLRGLLQDECPRAKREISVLLQALDERIPQDLLRVHSGEPIRSLSPRLAKRLVDEKAMSADASRWAVHTWAQGLGLAPVGGTGGSGVGFDMPPRPRPFDEADPLLVDLPVPEPVPIPGPVTRWPVKAILAAIAVVALGAGGWSVFMQPKLEISSVEALGPLVGNGKPLAMQLAYQARNVVPKEVEVRFVRGDGNWKPEPLTVAIDAASQGSEGRVPAGSFTYRTAKPVHVTFSYTLVAANGRRSAPFERTFDIAPPVTIAEATVPKGLQVGKAFNIGFRYLKGSTDIVKIERRVVQTSGTWGNPDFTQTVKYTEPSGSFDYRFEPFTQAMNSTVEFTLIDAEGLRSEPYRVAINVAPVPAPAAEPLRNLLPGGLGLGRSPLATVLSVRELRQQGESTGLGAVAAGIFGGLLGNQTGKGGGRTVMTGLGLAGGAVAGNEIEKNMRATSSWETTVRFDDGSVRTLRQGTPPTWRAGERVGVDNGVIVARR
jgi:hypothetical protein